MIFTLSRSKLGDLSSEIMQNILQLSILRNGKPTENVFLHYHGHRQPLDSLSLLHGSGDRAETPHSRNGFFCPLSFSYTALASAEHKDTLDGKILFLLDIHTVDF